MTIALWVNTPISSANSVNNLAHLEWCNIFESSIPLGVSTQSQKQTLINGYSSVEWLAEVITPIIPTPSGNTRSLGFTNKNRGISSIGKNRVLSVSNTGRKFK
jgi:hypothetical protein